MELGSDNKKHIPDDMAVLEISICMTSTGKEAALMSNAPDLMKHEVERERGRNGTQAVISLTRPMADLSSRIQSFTSP